MNKCSCYLKSSVGRKQIIALTGIGLVLFLIAHLSGNLLMFKGPEAFNAYAAKLKSLGILLVFMRVGLIATFAAHIIFTVMLVLENKKARKVDYAVKKDEPGRSFATKTMRYTGPLLFLFLVLHLLDFTLPTPFIRNELFFGDDLGLFGIVANAFLNPLRVVFYIAAMFAVGFHLSHGIQSVVQTFGYHHPERVKVIKKLSRALGVIIAIGFSSIPIYINIVAYSGSGL